MNHYPPKSGKTTTATKFPHHLLLAFEKGYNAIPGAMAAPINTWSEFKKAIRDLKKIKKMRDDAEAKGDTATLNQLPNYETIIIDTVDIAYDYCEKYICDNAPRSKEQGGGFGVDSISDIPFGKGYTMVGKEFDECLRSIVQMDYGLVLISHSVDKTFTDESGKEYNQIVPTLASKPRNIVSRMADIIGYSRTIDNNGKLTTKLFMRGTPRYMAGSRFKYTPESIDFNYKSLVDAIGEAIDKQASEDGQEYFTETRSNLYTIQELNFDELMSQFRAYITEIRSKYATQEEYDKEMDPRIRQITDRHLGKGVKVSSINRDQVEALDLIVSDLKNLVEEF